jgi:hypothetical protein
MYGVGVGVGSTNPSPAGGELICLSTGVAVGLVFDILEVPGVVAAEAFDGALTSVPFALSFGSFGRLASGVGFFGDVVAAGLRLS